MPCWKFAVGPIVTTQVHVYVCTRPSNRTVILTARTPGSDPWLKRRERDPYLPFPSHVNSWICPWEDIASHNCAPRGQLIDWCMKASTKRWGVECSGRTALAGNTRTLAVTHFCSCVLNKPYPNQDEMCTAGAGDGLPKLNCILNLRQMSKVFFILDKRRYWKLS